MPTMPRNLAVGREAAAGEIAALGKRDGRLAAVGRAREGGTEQLALVVVANLRVSRCEQERSIFRGPRSPKSTPFRK